MNLESILWSHDAYTFNLILNLQAKFCHPPHQAALENTAGFVAHTRGNTAEFVLSKKNRIEPYPLTPSISRTYK